MSDEAVSLVFVHGFQGDHTSFQAFPTHVHLAVTKRIPQLQTFVYPTYKARRPIQSATKDLVEWMKKALPRGPVILLGHSMGGLLIAEAAFDPESEDRIIGLTSFDVPFIGIHPHVVVSGLASLFKGKEGESEHAVNDPNSVNVERPGLTPRASFNSEQTHEAKPEHGAGLSSGSGGVSSASAGWGISPSAPRPPSLHLSAPPPSRPPNATLAAAFQLLNLGEPSDSLQNKLHWLNKHRSKPFTAFGSRIWEMLEFSSCLLDPVDLYKRYQKMVQWGRRPGKTWVNYWTETVPKVKPPEDQPDGKSEKATPEEPANPGPTDGQENDDEEYHTPDEGDFEENGETFEMAALLAAPDIDNQSSSQSSNQSITSTSTVTESKDESTQASSVTSLSDGPEKQDVREDVDHEDGHELTPEEKKAKEKAEREAMKERERAEKQARKEQDKKEKEERKRSEQEAREAKKAQERLLKEAKAKKKKADEKQVPRHFIVTPSKPSREWVRIPIAGVDDEVAAHCGLFFKEENWDYDVFVDNVSRWIIECWERNQQQRGQRT